MYRRNSGSLFLGKVGVLPINGFSQLHCQACQVEAGASMVHICTSVKVDFWIPFFPCICACLPFLVEHYWQPETISREWDAFSRLIVMGGDSRTRTIDSIDLADNSATCDTMADIPVRLRRPVAFRSRGKVLLCAGSMTLSQCWKYNATANAWEEGPDMFQSRFSAAVLQLNADDFWITGGKSDPQIEDIRDFLPKCIIAVLHTLLKLICLHYTMQ